MNIPIYISLYLNIYYLNYTLLSIKYFYSQDTKIYILNLTLNSPSAIYITLNLLIIF